MSKGRIDVTLDPVVVDEIKALLAQIEARMPFLLRLSNSEKKHLVKPKAGAEGFIQSIIDLQRQVGMISGDDDAVLADLSVFTGLTSISDIMSDLLQRINDTKLQAGSESWNESLIRYGMLRQIERRNPEIKAGLDRLQPLIVRRSTRPAPIKQPEPTIPGDDDSTK